MNQVRSAEPDAQRLLVPSFMPTLAPVSGDGGSQARATRPPRSPRANDLIRRADSELLAAQYSGEAWEQFTHAHLAALRAGAAVVALRGAPSGRRPPRTVWAMLHRCAPEFDGWSDYFEAGASARAAVDAGRFDAVSTARAEQALCTAEDFVDAVRALVLTHAVAGPSAQAS